MLYFKDFNKNQGCTLKLLSKFSDHFFKYFKVLFFTIITIFVVQNFEQNLRFVLLVNSNLNKWFY